DAPGRGDVRDARHALARGRRARLRLDLAERPFLPGRAAADGAAARGLDGARGAGARDVAHPDRHPRHLQLLPLAGAGGEDGGDGRRALGRPSGPRHGERVLLRLVARHADVWNHGGDVAELEHKLGVLRRHCAAEGRDYEAVEKSWFGNVIVDPDPARAQARLERAATAWGMTPAQMES